MRHTFSKGRISDVIGYQQGLSQAQVIQRRHRYGNNAILDTQSSGWRDVMRDTAKDPMVWFLVGTALIFVWLNDYTEAAILVIALIPIVGMDTYLHRRTRATTEGLSGRLASQATVIRDGDSIAIAASELVPGDLAIVATSEYFPADGLIVTGDSLQVDESALTGEAMPVRKRMIGSVESASAEGSVDSLHWGAAGTRLLTGDAHLLIVHTGRETLYGQIAHSAQTDSQKRTPLQHAISSLVTVLIVISVILCFALAVIRYSQGYGLLDAILSAVTLAIAALPEEFPVVFTFFLGVGVYRLAQQQALVRRAVVVENIGRISCVCTDKTGTLTEGRLILGHTDSAADIGEQFVLQAAATAARAQSNDPLDKLLLKAAEPLPGTRVEVFPFTEDRRREVAVVNGPTNRFFSAVKGAPETVLAMTRLSEDERDRWLNRTHELAITGHKVIAIAHLELESWFGGEPDRDYNFVGLLAFEDPIREGVSDAITRAQAAGIRIIMVTGDHPDTAFAIARDLGISSERHRVIEGVGLAERLHRQGPETLSEIDVIARAIPTQKLDLVQALQRNGEIVSVTGDGVNDVPALQGADVGIAMGERGTRSAREVASIVLLDDNFRTIIRAIGEGRQLFLNLKLSFAYLLMIHAPLVATAALIPLFGFPLLYLPAHIVWLELIIHPTALLVFQQLPSSDKLEGVERHAKLRFFDAKEWAVIALVGTLLTGLIILGFYYSLGEELDVAHARSVAMIALVVGSATVTTVLSGLRTRSAIIIVTLSLCSAAILVQMRPLAQLLHMSPMHAIDWTIAVLGGIVAGSFAYLITLFQHTSD